MFDVNIEKDPTLIPTVDHEMDSRVLYPHESAIAAGVTLQALWALRREYNLNADSMAMTALRNILAADKDRKRLNDMYFFMKDERSWSYAVPDGVYFQEYYETLKQTLLTIDSVLMNRTGVSGLVGIVADSLSSVLFRTMREPNFVAAPGYVRRPQPHFVGRLFGMWDLYEDPQGTSYTSLCYAKGANHGEAGYVAGDAVPALTFKHSIHVPPEMCRITEGIYAYCTEEVARFGGRVFSGIYFRAEGGTAQSQTHRWRQGAIGIMVIM